MVPSLPCTLIWKLKVRMRQLFIHTCGKEVEKQFKIKVLSLFYQKR